MRRGSLTSHQPSQSDSYRYYGVISVFLTHGFIVSCTISLPINLPISHNLMVMWANYELRPTTKASLVGTNDLMQ